MTDVAIERDWTRMFARRTRGTGAGAITAILSLAGARDVITFSGGFPAPETFGVGVLQRIASRLISEDPGVALQYSATEGLESLRDYLGDRLALQQGLRPAPDELMITSGGIDCMELLAKSLIDPGDPVVVEAPSYLGAIMAFRGYEADVHAVPMDGDGLLVDQVEDQMAAGLRPKLLYVIPEYQNPTGLTLNEERRRALVGLARRYGFLILEDVAYRELGFSGDPLPSLWSLAPDVVVQAGTFSKTFFPGVRLGWACGPRAVISQLIVAKQNSDQCAGALGQRLLEEYGRSGHLDRQIIESRRLYARRAELTERALQSHLPSDSSWTSPRGGFFTWVTIPGVDTVALSPLASATKVAYVPGRPFYTTAAGSDQLRLAYSRVADQLIDQGISRIGDVARRALHE